MRDANELTCVNVHKLATDLKMAPLTVANVASRRDMRIRQCQLGCF
jgi:hypothetical protein